MCGIVGYIGSSVKASEHQALDVLMEGLRRLEYRGYDSAGVATVAGGVLQSRKRSGKLLNLVEAVEQEPLESASVGIGHTRWATHGGPTDENAHPHLGDGGKLAVIHNGIVENFSALKKPLVAAGHRFDSQTDTEVVAKLVGELFASQAQGDLTEAMRLAVNELQGAFTLLAVHADEHDRVVAARRSSPLVGGLGEGECC